MKILKMMKNIILIIYLTHKRIALNLQFRKKNYATDVLSFESADPECLGELVLCPEVLKRQAGEHKLSFKMELTYMFIHGVLHLLGYDHEQGEKQAQAMFELQDRFFERLS